MTLEVMFLKHVNFRISIIYEIMESLFTVLRQSTVYTAIGYTFIHLYILPCVLANGLFNGN